jgi:uncharacterized protein (TIGR02145 family)
MIQTMKKVLSLSLLLLLVTLFYGCKKETPAKIPVLSTAPIINVTAITATSGGSISSDGGAAISVRGVCWGLTADPTTADSKTTDGDGTGQFVSTLNNLSAGETYHVRAYATNSIGTAYGNDLSFTALGEAPVATTQAATNISYVGAKLNGTVNAGDLSTTVTFEYGTTTSYGQIADATPAQVTGSAITGVSADISGLTPGITYHFRIKAVNSAGNSYGGDMIFTTTDISTPVTDIDGNIYNTVIIGTQVWMIEGLKATKYTDGTAIPNVVDNTEWSTNTTGAYCDYSNNAANSNIYGKLYNWYVVASTNAKKVCPTGWHVPDDSEWTTLITFLGGESLAGGKLKETGTTHWFNPNSGATNESEFTALPGGYRSGTGTFGLLGNTGFWWSSAEANATYAWYLYMYYDTSSAIRSDMDKHDGFSVRCVKN